MASHAAIYWARLTRARREVPERTDALHSLPTESPETETNIVPVCTSNISILVFSRHDLVGSTTSPMLTTARTSFDSYNAGMEIDSPAFSCSVVALPMREPSAPKKLTCTWHGVTRPPYGSFTFEMTARTP